MKIVLDIMSPTPYNTKGKNMSKEYFARNIILKDAILRCLSTQDIKAIHKILEKSLLETSDYEQERMIARGEAHESDFFYDTYLGPLKVNQK